MTKLTHSELIKRRKEYSTQYYKQNKIRIAKRNAAKHGLGFNILFENPFSSCEQVEYHHINNNDVIILPRFIHRLYTRFDETLHRELLIPIIKQIYGDKYDEITGTSLES